MNDDYETVREHCKHKDCAYRRKLEQYTPYCDYIGATGKARGCSISQCDKYSTKRVKFCDDWQNTFIF